MTFVASSFVRKLKDIKWTLFTHLMHNHMVLFNMDINDPKEALFQTNFSLVTIFIC